MKPKVALVKSSKTSLAEPRKIYFDENVFSLLDKQEVSGQENWLCQQFASSLMAHFNEFPIYISRVRYIVERSNPNVGCYELVYADTHGSVAETVIDLAKKQEKTQIAQDFSACPDPIINDVELGFPEFGPRTFEMLEPYKRKYQRKKDNQAQLFNEGKIVFYPKTPSQPVIAPKGNVKIFKDEDYSLGSALTTFEADPAIIPMFEKVAKSKKDYDEIVSDIQKQLHAHRKPKKDTAHLKGEVVDTKKQDAVEDKAKLKQVVESTLSSEKEDDKVYLEDIDLGEIQTILGADLDVETILTNPLETILIKNQFAEREQEAQDCKEFIVHTTKAPYLAYCNLQEQLNVLKKQLVWAIYTAAQEYYLNEVQLKTVDKPDERQDKIESFNKHFLGLVKITDGTLSDIEIIYQILKSKSLEQVGQLVDSLLKETNTSYFFSSHKLKTLVPVLQVISNNLTRLLKSNKPEDLKLELGEQPVFAATEKAWLGAVKPSFTWNSELIDQEKAVTKDKDTAKEKLHEMTSGKEWKSFTVKANVNFNILEAPQTDDGEGGFKVRHTKFKRYIRNFEKLSETKREAKQTKKSAEKLETEILKKAKVAEQDIEFLKVHKNTLENSHHEEYEIRRKTILSQMKVYRSEIESLARQILALQLEADPKAQRRKIQVMEELRISIRTSFDSLKKQNQELDSLQREIDREKISTEAELYQGNRAEFNEDVERELEQISATYKSIVGTYRVHDDDTYLKDLMKRLQDEQNKIIGLRKKDDDLSTEKNVLLKEHLVSFSESKTAIKELFPLIESAIKKRKLIRTIKKNIEILSDTFISDHDDDVKKIIEELPTQKDVTKADIDGILETLLDPQSEMRFVFEDSLKSIKLQDDLKDEYIAYLSLYRNNKYLLVELQKFLSERTSFKELLENFKVDASQEGKLTYILSHPEQAQSFYFKCKDEFFTSFHYFQALPKVISLRSNLKRIQKDYRPSTEKSWHTTDRSIGLWIVQYDQCLKDIKKLSEKYAAWKVNNFLDNDEGVNIDGVSETLTRKYQELRALSTKITRTIGAQTSFELLTKKQKVYKDSISNFDTYLAKGILLEDAKKAQPAVKKNDTTLLKIDELNSPGKIALKGVQEVQPEDEILEVVDKPKEEIAIAENQRRSLESFQDVELNNRVGRYQESRKNLLGAGDKYLGLKTSNIDMQMRDDLELVNATTFNLYSSLKEAFNSVEQRLVAEHNQFIDTIMPEELNETAENPKLTKQFKELYTLLNDAIMALQTKYADLQSIKDQHKLTRTDTKEKLAIVEHHLYKLKLFRAQIESDLDCPLIIEQRRNITRLRKEIASLTSQAAKESGVTKEHTTSLLETKYQELRDARIQLVASLTAFNKRKLNTAYLGQKIDVFETIAQQFDDELNTHLEEKKSNTDGLKYWRGRFRERFSDGVRSIVSQHDDISQNQYSTVGISRVLLSEVRGLSKRFKKAQPKQNIPILVGQESIVIVEKVEKQPSALEQQDKPKEKPLIIPEFSSENSFDEFPRKGVPEEGLSKMEEEQSNLSSIKSPNSLRKTHIPGSPSLLRKSLASPLERSVSQPSSPRQNRLSQVSTQQEGATTTMIARTTSQDQFTLKIEDILEIEAQLKEMDEQYQKEWQGNPSDEEEIKKPSKLEEKAPADKKTDDEIVAEKPEQSIAKEPPKIKIAKPVSNALAESPIKTFEDKIKVILDQDPSMEIFELGGEDQNYPIFVEIAAKRLANCENPVDFKASICQLYRNGDIGLTTLILLNRLASLEIERGPAINSSELGTLITEYEQKEGKGFLRFLTGNTKTINDLKNLQQYARTKDIEQGIAVNKVNQDHQIKSITELPPEMRFKIYEGDIELIMELNPKRRNGKYKNDGLTLFKQGDTKQVQPGQRNKLSHTEEVINKLHNQFEEKKRSLRK